MAYFRTLHPEEMIWGDVGEKALGSRGALTCGAAQNARLDSRQRDRHIAVPSKTERREYGPEPLLLGCAPCETTRSLRTIVAI